MGYNERFDCKKNRFLGQFKLLLDEIKVLGSNYNFKELIWPNQGLNYIIINERDIKELRKKKTGKIWKQGRACFKKGEEPLPFSIRTAPALHNEKEAYATERKNKRREDNETMRGQQREESRTEEERRDQNIGKKEKG